MKHTHYLVYRTRFSGCLLMLAYLAVIAGFVILAWWAL